MIRDPKERLDTARRELLLGRIWRPSGASTEPRSGPLPPCLDAAAENPDRVCLDCEAPCLSSCPEGIILRHEEPHAFASVPYLSFEKSGCTFCGDCRQICPACPTPDAEAPDIGLASISESECMAMNGVVCKTCAFSCPERAIAFDRRGRPSVIAESCNGCGLCVPVCPPRAISVTF